MNVVLLSTYELGRQPFGLASPAAWIRAQGASVTCADLSRSPLPQAAVQEADLVALYLPMHTATRLAAQVIGRVRRLNPRAHLCGYGLYAPMNEEFLRGIGVQTILGGEFEQSLADLVHGLENGCLPAPSHTSLERLHFIVPDRTGLPSAKRYATLLAGGVRKVVGYTEASRGCKHLCRHCPVVPVYNGVFRVVQKDVVLEDIRRQVAAGVEHITFGDPDFFNGVGHAMAIVEALHREHPSLTYDVTIKIEHLLQQRRHLGRLAGTGCLFVTSAVESIDDAVLNRLDKGHTRADFIEAMDVTRRAGLTLSPTFIPFTPWTTWENYRELLRLLADLDLVENVAPIQLAIRLLIPAGSRLLELEEVRGIVGPFEPAALSYPWKHCDAALDRLCTAIQDLIKREERGETPRQEIFRKIWKLANSGLPLPENYALMPRAAIPYLNEPWYC